MLPRVTKYLDPAQGKDIIIIVINEPKYYDLDLDSVKASI